MKIEDKKHAYLHKIKEGFVLTSDEKILQGDTCLYNTGQIIKYDVQLNTDNLSKVIAQQDQLDLSSLSEKDQKEIGWFDIDKLYSQYFPKLYQSEERSIGEMVGFKIGCDITQQLLSDKQFTLEDIRSAIQFGQSLGYSYGSQESYNDSQKMIEIDLEQNKDVVKYTQQLTKTSWEVECIKENDKIRILKLL